MLKLYLELKSKDDEIQTLKFLVYQKNTGRQQAEVKEFEILVKFEGKSQLSLKVSQDSTIEDIKGMIKQNIGIKIYQQTLIFRG